MNLFTFINYHFNLSGVTTNKTGELYMKKIILSAAVAAMAFSTSAVAADKGIDIDVSGQAVLYYETHDGNGLNNGGAFDQSTSAASAGIQLNLGADLGNNFTFGSQISYLGSLGLEETIVNQEKQNTGIQGGNGITTAELALTKIFIAKKMGNTTVKMGRQELPKSLSPLAFSEGWNVYKNTFDAILAINTDLPKTTLVGAYVTGGTGMGLGTTGDLAARTNAGNLTVDSETYMLTAQTKLIPMTTLTVSYYDLKDVGGNVLGAANQIGADAIWADAKIKLPANLGLALQGGQISPEKSSLVKVGDTNALGAKLTAKLGKVSLKAIYTQVDADDGAVTVAVANTGTGIKSPLYSQMMYNQKAIDTDNETIVVGAGFDAGTIGKFAVNYGMTSVGKNNMQNATITDKDYSELDLVYKVKSSGVQYFAIVAIRDWDKGLTMNTTTGVNNTGMDKDTVVRFWARYNF